MITLINKASSTYGLLLFTLLCACSGIVHEQDADINWFDKHPEFVADGFDYPVGPPTGEGYYNAQPFRENNHLGDDWNGIGGGNTDLGDPVYATANGYVNFAADMRGGWGNVIRITHRTEDNTGIHFYESLYAHCATLLVKEGEGVKRGQKIASIGTAGGQYLAHLHFEIRDILGMSIGPGYARNTSGYLDPTVFMDTH